MPFFCRGEKGNADLDSFRAITEELAPLLGEVQLPRLSGDMLYEVVQKKDTYCWQSGRLGLEGIQGFA